MGEQLGSRRRVDPFAGAVGHHHRDVGWHDCDKGDAELFALRGEERGIGGQDGLVADRDATRDPELCALLAKLPTWIHSKRVSTRSE